VASDTQGLTSTLGSAREYSHIIFGYEMRDILRNKIIEVCDKKIESKGDGEPGIKNI